jgi:hypothetical protein
LRGLWRAVGVSVVALEQSGIVRPSETLCLTHIVTTFCIRKYALCLTRVGLQSEVIY